MTVTVDLDERALLHYLHNQPLAHCTIDMIAGFLGWTARQTRVKLYSGVDDEDTIRVHAPITPLSPPSTSPMFTTTREGGQRLRRYEELLAGHAPTAQRYPEPLKVPFHVLRTLRWCDDHHDRHSFGYTLEYAISTANQRETFTPSDLTAIGRMLVTGAAAGFEFPLLAYYDPDDTWMPSAYGSGILLRRSITQHVDVAPPAPPRPVQFVPFGGTT